MLLLLVIAGAAGYVYYSATASQGVLEVTTYPEGARIFIDGGEVGTSPDRITGVQLGLREVSVGKEGYETYSRLFQFNPGSERQLIVYLSDKDIEIGPYFEVIATTSGGSSSHEEHLYMPTTDGRIFAIDKKSKDKVWETHAENETFLYQPVTAGDRLFIPSFYGPVLALDQTHGNIAWETSIPERLIKLLATDQGLLGISFRSQLIALDFEGDILWESDPQRELIGGSLFSGEEEAIVLSRKGDLLAIDLADGGVSLIEGFDIGEIIEVAQNRNKLAAVGKENTLLLWDKEIGSPELWDDFDVPGLNNLFLTSQLLVWGDNQGVMTAFNLETGEKAWERPLYTPTSAFAFFEDHLYFGTHDGSVFILCKDSGEVLGKRSLAVRSRITSISSDDDPNLLHVTNRGGKIVTLFLPSF